MSLDGFRRSGGQRLGGETDTFFDAGHALRQIGDPHAQRVDPFAQLVDPHGLLVDPAADIGDLGGQALVDLGDLGGQALVQVRDLGGQALVECGDLLHDRCRQVPG